MSGPFSPEGAAAVHPTPNALGASMTPFAEIRSWMFDAALPFWGSAGVDRARGGFFEELDLNGQPTAASFKRTRVVCRQIYAFAHGALLGWREGLDLSAYGYEYLTSRAWLGPDKGWARRLTADGEVLDASIDLYDLAFVLFALAWRHKASGDRDPLVRAHQLLDFLDAHCRAGPGMGFLHEQAPGGWRWQNPHMHLLEASLAMYEASGDQRFLSLAGELVALFRRVLFDGRTLAEYFDTALARAPGEAGRIIEPGHQFEWAWILSQYQRLANDDVAAEARALVSFGEAHGVDRATQVAYNQIRDDGAPLDRGSRAWPNTERIKGHVALFENGERGSLAAIEGSARLLLDRYLAVSPRGLWIDDFDAEGRPLAKVAPASTLYHIFLAFAEVLRIEPQVTAHV